MECKKCKINKESTEFSFKNKEKGLLHCVCKICQREYKRTHYYNNKDAHYKRNLKTKDKLYEIISLEKSKGCLMCDENFHKCLEFHHLEKNDKIDTISTLKRNGSVKKLIDELKKCVLLCSNCHRKVHYNTEFNDKMLKKLNTDIV